MTKYSDGYADGWSDKRHEMLHKIDILLSDKTITRDAKIIIAGVKSYLEVG